MANTTFYNYKHFSANVFFTIQFWFWSQRKLANRQANRSQTSDKQGRFNKLTQFNSELLMGSTQGQISLSNTDDRLHMAVNDH